MINFTSNHAIDENVICGDKSISHRALILAAISNGKCVLRNLSLCKDVLTTANCLRALGAQVEICGTTATVLPITLPKNAVQLNCENSGTTARLLAGLVAGLGVECTFFGDDSLSKRPMDRILQPLSQMGARFEKGEGYLFKNVPSKLHGESFVAQTKSAQVKSGVLLAGLFATGETRYVEKVATRNHTEILLQRLGANVSCNGTETTVSQSGVCAFQTEIPNDISSVAFPVALALLDGTSHVFRNVCVNPRRTGFVKVLQSSGANVVLKNIRNVFGEVVADVCVEKSVLQPLSASGADVCDAIDEIPVLAALALATKGKHLFCDVGELQHKECNRIQAIIHTANACGQRATFDGKNLLVESNGVLRPKPHFTTFGDHRIAMSQAVLALGACNGGSLDGENWEISFPQFLQSVGAKPQKFGLLGSDISRSLSPVLMQRLAQNADVCCSYNLAQLPSNVCDQTLAETLQQFDGANVTMPFKTRVAQLFGCSFAVNTVGKNVQPQSTDGYGIVQALNNNKVTWQNSPLWIVGAGGAAESCVAELKKYGCKMQIVNRTQSHADALTQKYGLENCVQNPVGVLSFVPPCDFLQQLQLPQSVRFVFSAIYKQRCPLQQKAEQRNLTFIGGLEMLYFQGAKSFSLWTGTPLQNDFEGFLKQLTSNVR
ncbi:MAG: 3-phosphoshikimate 1-carboxyvinyltransferase [Candidatus Fimimonas sp.]